MRKLNIFLANFVRNHLHILLNFSVIKSRINLYFTEKLHMYVKPICLMKTFKMINSNLNSSPKILEATCSVLTKLLVLY